jgi:ribosome-binding factor A
VENRSAQHHKDRQVEAIKEELTLIVTGELNDPRIGLVTVNEVVMAPGGKSARIYVSLEGDEKEQKQSLSALTEAVGYIRHQLADALSLRVAPDVHFVADTSVLHGARVEQLLTRIEKRERKRKP